MSTATLLEADHFNLALRLIVIVFLIIREHAFEVSEVDFVDDFETIRSFGKLLLGDRTAETEVITTVTLCFLHRYSLALDGLFGDLLLLRGDGDCFDSSHGVEHGRLLLALVVTVWVTGCLDREEVVLLDELLFL